MSRRGSDSFMPKAKLSIPYEPVNHEGERNRRLKKAWISSILIRPLSLLTTLITIPLFLKYLGNERYGLFESVGAMAAWLAATNLGLTMGLQNRLVKFEIAEDRQSAREHVSTLFFAMLAAIGVMLLLITLATPAINWTSLFKLTDPVAQREAPWAFWVAAVGTLAGLLTSLPGSIYFANQELHKNNLWDGIARVVTLASCFAITLTNLGVAGAIIALSLVPAIVRIVNLAVLFGVEKPWLRPSLRLFSPALLRSLAYDGVAIFMLQFSCAMLYQMDRFIIGTVRGMNELVGYSILGKLYISIYAVFMLFLHPLWAAYGHALGRGDVQWVLKFVRRSTLVGFAVVGSAGICLLFFGPWMFSRLPASDNQGQSVSASLIVAFTLSFLLRAYVDSRSTVLLAANVIRPQLLYYCGHFAVYVVMAVPAAYWWGAEGVAWSGPVSGVLTSGLGYHLLIRRYIIGREKHFQRTSAGTADSLPPPALD